MNIKPLFLNSLASVNQMKQGQNSSQTNSINSQPLKFDTVSFGKSDNKTGYSSKNLDAYIDNQEYCINNIDRKRKALVVLEQEEKARLEALISLKEALAKDSSDVGIFKAFGAEVEENKDGTLTISKFDSEQLGEINVNPAFIDLEIDGNTLLSRVKNVKGDLGLYCLDITKLDRLETIGGNFIAPNTLMSADNLKSVYNANFGDSRITDLPALENIGKNAVLNSKQHQNMKDKLKDNTFNGKFQIID